MTYPAAVMNKTRVLFNETGIAADAYYPAYTPGSAWKADMRGALIGAAKVTLANLTTFTAVDVTLYDSKDGVTWDTWKAFTQLTADGSEILNMAGERSPNRFIRAYVDVTGTPGTADVKVELFYCQVGPRGEYADGVVRQPE